MVLPFGWARGVGALGMEDFGGMRDWASDVDARSDDVDLAAFPCFVRPVKEFKPRSEVDARVAGEHEVEDERFYDHWEDRVATRGQKGV